MNTPVPRSLETLRNTARCLLRAAARPDSDRAVESGPALALALAFAITVALLAGGCSRTASAGRDPKGAAAAAVPVTVAQAAREDIPVQLTGIGTVRPFSTVSVKSQNKGELASVGFNQGDEVQAGDLIFLIEPKPFQVAVDQARANLGRDRALLEKAQADFRRADGLHTENIISQADFEQSRAEVDSMKATLEADAAAVTNAQVQLSHCYIRSPIRGRVGTLLVNQGNVVKDVDTVLAVINQMKPIYVDFFVRQQDLPAVREQWKKGDLKMAATIPGYEGHRADGRLVLVNNEVDVNTGAILLRGEFTNSDELLWPGQLVNVALTLSIEHDAVVVPSTAIQLGQDGHTLCVVRPDDTVEIRQVDVGRTHGEETVVTKGVQPGERIVTSGQLRLVRGARVRVQETEREPAGKGEGV